MKQALEIKLSDVARATMPEESGNEGFVGIAPDGSEYHVVAPVDRQIARGLRFWIPPDDGTPFGGYKDWRYFCCLTYDVPQGHPRELEAHLEKTRENAWLIQQWEKGLGFEIRVIDDLNRHSVLRTCS
jgi:hypothetical protein